MSRALHGLNAAHHPLRARVPHEASRNAIGPERSGETPNAGERLKGVWMGVGGRRNAEDKDKRGTQQFVGCIPGPSN